MSSIINIYNKKNTKVWGWGTNNNTSDCIASEIPEYIKSQIRQNFDIGYNEEILFVRDTSFWDNRDQGLVITDEKIYCIPDNDSPDEKIELFWWYIDRVEYKDEVLYFWNNSDNEPYGSIHISFFLKDDSESYKIGRSMSKLFTDMAQSVAPEVSLYEQVWEKADEDVEEALELAISNRYSDLSLFYPICFFSQQGNEPEKVIQYATEGINEILSKESEEIDENNYTQLYALLTYLRYSAYAYMEKVDENYQGCRKDALATLDFIAEDTEFAGKIVKNEAKNDFALLNAAYATDFLSFPYNERKLLYPCKEYSNLNQDFISVLDLENLKNTGINFPIGHPVANQLYVGHPFLPSKYMPFENYELELIEDKVREFCHIMQSLGATEIDIECLNSISNNTENNNKKNLNGKAGNKLVSVAGSGNIDSTTKFIEEISRSLNLHQRFNPKEAPKLPENLVWFEHEPAWQRIYTQRMQGSLLEHEERMETKKSQMVDNTELKQVSIEVEHLLADANVSYKQELKEKFEGHENATLAIRVKFANIENLSSNKLLPESKNQEAYTGNELEYIEEYKACIDGDGEISPSERRLLERFREKLGIPIERAKELEQSFLTPKLTDAEKEYLEEYKACIESDGKISANERRLLNRLRDTLGISEARANEIEKL